MSDSTRKPKIPHFQSYEEEVRFWEEHSPLDFEGEFEEVQLEFARPLTHTFAVPLDAKMIDQLWRMAAERGVQMDEMMRAWIEERWEIEAKRDVNAKRAKP